MKCNLLISCASWNYNAFFQKEETTQAVLANQAPNFRWAAYWHTVLFFFFSLTADIKVHIKNVCLNKCCRALFFLCVEMWNTSTTEQLLWLMLGVPNSSKHFPRNFLFFLSVAWLVSWKVAYPPCCSFWPALVRASPLLLSWRSKWGCA